MFFILCNSNKDRDNKFNLLVNKLKGTIGHIENIYTMVLAIHNDTKNKTKFSYNTDNLIHSLPYKEEYNTKLKIAKKTRIIRDNGRNRKNRK